MAGKTYNPRANQLIVGGAPITGLAEDGVVFEFAEDTSELTVGLDGEHVNRVINNESGTCTINLLSTSASVAVLMAQHRAIKAALNEGIEADIGSFFYKDPLNGDVIEDDVFYFQRVPDPSKGNEAPVYTFVLSLPNARGRMILAANRI